MPTPLPRREPIKGRSLPCFQTREGQGLDTCIQALKHFSTPLSEELLLVQTTNPHKALFPATKMFPELRHIWKVLENPTGRRLGQESSFSLAIQEALHKMFALQDRPVQEPTSQGWRIMVDKGVLWGTEPMEKCLGSFTNHVPTRDLM